MPVISCDIGLRPTPAIVEAAVTGLMLMSLEQLRTDARIPPIYESGVRYEREPFRRERWQTALESYQRGIADCEDLAAWLCAELRLHGEPARIYCYAPKPGLIHCVVERANGQLEDPSKKLGMGGVG